MGTSSDGASPHAALILSDNTLYGTAENGGSNGSGMVAFSVSLGANSVMQGSLQVTIMPSGAVKAGAQWQVDGGRFQPNGATVSGLSVGNHIVAFSKVTGWTAPEDQVVNIRANQTTAIYGTYAAVVGSQTGSLSVTIDPPAVITNGARWRVDGGLMRSSGTLVSGLSVGNHTVSFTPVGGWTTPVPQTVSVTANMTAITIGNYVAIPQTGLLEVTIKPAAILPGAQWQVDGNGTWQNSAATVANVSVGKHLVTFTPIAGWTMPGSAIVSIKDKSLTKVTGTYTFTSQGIFTMASSWGMT